MTKNWWVVALKSAVIVIFCLSSISRADLNKTGTITLKSGQVYENVDYKVVSIYQVIVITDNEGTRDIYFNDIEKITDMNGDDITGEILGKHHSGSITKPKNYKPAGPATYRQSYTKLWHAAVRVAGTFSSPVGDYYEGIGAGLGFEGDVRIAATYEMAFRFMVSRTGLGLEDDWFFYSLNPDTTILSQNYKFTGLRYVAAIEYYRHFNNAHSNMNMWFIYGGLGSFSNKITMEMRLHRNSTNENWDVNDLYTENKFILSFGAGFDMAITPQVAIEIAGGYDMEFIGSAETSSGDRQVVNAYILDLRAGLVFFLK